MTPSLLPNPQESRASLSPVQEANSVPALSEQTDAILRAAAYHRGDYDRAVVSFSGRKHTGIASTIASNFRNHANSLGELERLPLELIHAICLQLDIASLFALRHVNLRGRQIVNALYEFKIATTHALSCLCALLRTKSASWVSLIQFHDVLCHRMCMVCKSGYGDLVHLIRWIRCCTTCLEKRTPATRTTTVSNAKKVLRLSNKTLNKIPILDALPGKYSTEQNTYKRRHKLVSVQAALSASLEGINTVPRNLDGFSQLPYLDFMACCALPFYDLEYKQIQRGVSCAGCQLAKENDFYGRSLSYDVMELSYALRDMVYSKESFLEHFQNCEMAQLLWRQSDCGRTKPKDLPLFCKSRASLEPEEW